MSSLPTAELHPTTNARFAVLCVDDEPSILGALKRLFRPFGYRIFTADGGAEGLEILERESIDLVISDMRMPAMDGVAFLEQVRIRRPDIVRLLLTGHSDVSATIAAINRGQIFRYITKPWDDDDVTRLVQDALERRFLQQEKIRLEALTEHQNEALKEINATLEAKVEERTRALHEAMRRLESANDKLKLNFLTSIKVFSGLIDMRRHTDAGRSRRVAECAFRLARHQQMTESEAQDVMIAALLRDVGKFALPEALLETPIESLTPMERSQYIECLVRGQSILTPLAHLKGPAALIRSQHEHFDGSGLPDGLKGAAIPLGARILAVANDYDALQTGVHGQRRLSPAQAQSSLLASRNRLYDPVVVDALVDMLAAAAKPAPSDEVVLQPGALLPGMVLSRDLVTREGMLLLARDHVLDLDLIMQLGRFARADRQGLAVHVRLDKE